MAERSSHCRLTGGPGGPVSPSRPSSPGKPGPPTSPYITRVLCEYVVRYLLTNATKTVQKKILKKYLVSNLKEISVSIHCLRLLK